MDKTERARLIRQWAKAKPQSKPYCPSGVAKANGQSTVYHPKRVRYVVVPKPTGRGFVSLGPLIPRNPPTWVQTPEAVEALTLALKRNQGEAPLTRIAKKLPAKLPVLTFCPKTRCRLG